MRASTITANDFLKGRAVRPHGILGRHSFKAHMEGISIVVIGQDGAPVNVEYAGTTDNRSCSACVSGVGFIGGWEYPHKAMPWKYMVESINRGVLYHDSASLPKAYRRAE